MSRVDSLVALNDLITATSSNDVESDNAPVSNVQAQALVVCCDDLINAFIYVIKDVFRYPVNQIPIRFTKYFVTIINKTCSTKLVMREI